MAELRHGDVSYEPTDVWIGPVVVFLAGLGIALAAALAVLWIAQSILLDSEQLANQRVSELAAEHARRPEEKKRPPEPQIEGIGLGKAGHSVTNHDLPTSARSQRETLEQMLTKGWTDAAGRRHPPIDEAMRMTVALLNPTQKEKP